MDPQLMRATTEEQRREEQRNISERVREKSYRKILCSLAFLRWGHAVTTRDKVENYNYLREREKQKHLDLTTNLLLFLSPSLSQGGVRF